MLGEVFEAMAEAKSAQVNSLLMRSQQRLVTILQGMSLVDYLLNLSSAAVVG